MRDQSVNPTDRKWPRTFEALSAIDRPQHGDVPSRVVPDLAAG